MARTRREVVAMAALAAQQRRWERYGGLGTPTRVSRPVRVQRTAEDALAETLRAYEHPEEPGGVASGHRRLAGALSGGAPAGERTRSTSDDQDGDCVGEDRQGPGEPSG
jgi:hypothetical protein